MKTTMLTAAIVMALLSPAAAAEPIEGNWQTASGETAVIAPCGDAFCVTLKTGQFAGRQIGQMNGQGEAYKGEITDPAVDKTYSGTSKVTGNSLQMQGCVLAIFCKSQTWTRL
tara:strand:+ start:4876 stop:5214 length:339 start_codon:yes stop_codon:yes gene_type:complete